MSGFTESIKVIQKERGGTGLGLSIVKHGALLHGAKVSVESEEGRGTKISMQFPRICQEINRNTDKT